MKSQFTALVVFVLMFAACSQSPTSYTVRGTLPDSTFNDQTLYIMRFDDNLKVDSTTVTGKDFVFEGVADDAELCRIQAGRMYYANFILENGKIEADFTTHMGSSTTPLNTEYNKFMKEQVALRDDYFAKRKEINEGEGTPEEKSKLVSDYYENNTKPTIEEILKRYFEPNKNNTIGAQILLDMSYECAPEEVEALLAQAGEFVQSRKKITDMAKRLDALKATAPGKLFTDFSLEQPDGSYASLSDYVGKGKYVLVDFWASWCGPCIQETPIIAEVYNKYKGDKFEVLGVAVWDKVEDTLKGIQTHNLPWPQILNGQSIPTDLYGINGIPHIILFGPDGTIVARELRGDGLKAKVAEVMAE